MATAAQEVLGGVPSVVVADQGYYHGTEIKTCLEAGLTPLVPRSVTSANEARCLFTKDDFEYDPGADVYRCPAGETLTCRSTTVELGGRPRCCYDLPAAPLLACAIAAEPETEK
jgi:hypothetical protein